MQLIMDFMRLGVQLANGYFLSLYWGSGHYAMLSETLHGVEVYSFNLQDAQLLLYILVYVLF